MASSQLSLTHVFFMTYFPWEEPNEPHHEYKSCHSNEQQYQFLPKPHKWRSLQLLKLLVLSLSFLNICFLIILDGINDFLIFFELRFEIIRIFFHPLRHTNHGFLNLLLFILLIINFKWGIAPFWFLFLKLFFIQK